MATTSDPAVAGLSRTPSGGPLPPPSQRDPRPRGVDPVVGWLGAALLTLVSFGLRLFHLDEPQRLAFDETYYAKHAWSMLHFGYVKSFTDEADKAVMAGDTMEIFGDGPTMVVHPDVGKWLIAAGEWAFGMDPFGWRIASAVVGALLVLLMCRFTQRVTGSVFWGLVGGALLGLDAMLFVLSRLALLDIFLAFFLLGGVHCVVADRQWFRRRLSDAPLPGRAWGPRVLARPWLLAAGIWFGLAVGTKWTALYPLAAFGLLVWLWSARARSSRGVRDAVWKSALVDGLGAFVQLVAVAGVVYVATWGGWLANADVYEEHLGANQYRTSDGGKPWPTQSEPDAEGLGEVTQSLRSLWYYHQDVYQFHTEGLNDSTHTYGSKPLGWMLVNRPVGVDAQNGIEPGEQGCDAPRGSTCLRQVLLIGNPVLWWGSCVALLAALVLWVGRRDWRFGVAVVGTASTWLPWLQYDDRPIFLFYMAPVVPFMVLACVLVMGTLVGPSRSPSTRRTVGIVVSGAFFVLVLLTFAWFWPILTDQLISRDDWGERIWFRRWI